MLNRAPRYTEGAAIRPLIPARPRPLLHDVGLTTARNLSPLMDEAVREERPVRITRGSTERERAILLDERTLRRLLAACTFTVEAHATEGGTWHLAVPELGLASEARTVEAASDALVERARAYVADYPERWAYYRHVPAHAAREGHVRRLSLCRDDAELAAVLFEGAGR